jgi:NADPH2:quinone reductase
MRGYEIEKHIKFEELQARLKDTSEPKVGQDEVLVDVYCAGLNFFDLLQIEVSHTSPHLEEGD